MKFPKLRLPRIRLPSWLRSSWRFIPALGDALMLLGGFVMLARGLWLIYEPAMWVICGGLLILAGLPKREGGAS